MEIKLGKSYDMDFSFVKYTMKISRILTPSLRYELKIQYNYIDESLRGLGQLYTIRIDKTNFSIASSSFPQINAKPGRPSYFYLPGRDREKDVIQARIITANLDYAMDLAHILCLLCNSYIIVRHKENINLKTLVA